MSLNNLLKLQAQKRQAETQPQPAKSPAPEVAESEVQVQSDGESTPTTDEPQPTAKPKGLGLKLAGKAGAPRAAQPAKPRTQEPQAVPPVSESLGGEFSLEDLAKLEAGSIEVEDSLPQGSGFEDEIEATAPERALAPDLTAEQLAFVESLDGIYQVLHDPELFGQSVRMVMIELQEHNEYEKLLADSDIHVMIRGMRRTMGLARVRKQEKTSKARTNKNARTKAGLADKDMALLNMLMGDGDD